MISIDTKKTSKNTAIFVCELCDFECSKKGDWNRHVTRPKHLKHVEMIQNDTNKDIKGIILGEFKCDCGNIYKHHSGLWRHKKTCELEKEYTKDYKKPDEPTDKDLIMLLIKENSELKTMMMKVLENGTNNTTNTTNTTHTNSHNKAFNLNFFLNETCKDAMNITDFVESIKLQLSDLEKVGELGYVEGISNIIVKNLKDLDVTQRPVHCTDKKRETMYIKDEDKWEKDDEQKKMHKMVRKVADKNARMVPKFKEAHPDCGKSSSRYSDQYNKIIMEAMGGRGDNDFEKEEKIIKRVSKEVIVEKDSGPQ
jgi:hypothetical protein